MSNEILSNPVQTKFKSINALFLFSYVILFVLLSYSYVEIVAKNFEYLGFIRNNSIPKLIFGLYLYFFCIKPSI